MTRPIATRLFVGPSQSTTSLFHWDPRSTPDLFPGSFLPPTTTPGRDNNTLFYSFGTGSLFSETDTPETIPESIGTTRRITSHRDLFSLLLSTAPITRRWADQPLYPEATSVLWSIPSDPMITNWAIERATWGHQEPTSRTRKGELGETKGGFIAPNQKGNCPSPSLSKKKTKPNQRKEKTKTKRKNGTSKKKSDPMG